MSYFLINCSQTTDTAEFFSYLKDALLPIFHLFVNAVKDLADASLVPLLTDKKVVLLQGEQEKSPRMIRTNLILSYQNSLAEAEKRLEEEANGDKTKLGEVPHNAKKIVHYLWQRMMMTAYPEIKVESLFIHVLQEGIEIPKDVINDHVDTIIENKNIDLMTRMQEEGRINSAYGARIRIHSQMSASDRVVKNFSFKTRDDEKDSQPRPLIEKLNPILGTQLEQAALIKDPDVRQWAVSQALSEYVAYCPGNSFNKEETIRLPTGENAWESYTLEFLSLGDNRLQAYICRPEKKDSQAPAYFVYRGTAPGREFDPLWIKNLQVNSNLHASGWAQIPVNIDFVLQKIEEMAKEAPAREVVVAGHSLGGVLALLTGVELEKKNIDQQHLMKKIRYMAFKSPKFGANISEGCAQLSDEQKARFINITNPDDFTDKIGQVRFGKTFHLFGVDRYGLADRHSAMETTENLWVSLEVLETDKGKKKEALSYLLDFMLAVGQVLLPIVIALYTHLTLTSEDRKALYESDLDHLQQELQFCQGKVEALLKNPSAASLEDILQQEANIKKYVANIEAVILRWAEIMTEEEYKKIKETFVFLQLVKNEPLLKLKKVIDDALKEELGKAVKDVEEAKRKKGLRYLQIQRSMDP